MTSQAHERLSDWLLGFPGVTILPIGPRPLHLNDLREVLADNERMREALGELLGLFDSYRESDLSHADAHACLVRYSIWERARQALSQGEGS